MIEQDTLSRERLYGDNKIIYIYAISYNLVIYYIIIYELKI